MGMVEVTPADLATYLGLPADTINEARATMLIDDAVNQALAIVKIADGSTYEDLPTGADSIIRAAAGRLYLNPAGATSEAVGHYSVTRPAASGSMFSKAEKRSLRLLAGGGGAFSIDLMPPDIAESLGEMPWWDVQADDESSSSDSASSSSSS